MLRLSGIPVTRVREVSRIVLMEGGRDGLWWEGFVCTDTSSYK